MLIPLGERIEADNSGSSTSTAAPTPTLPKDKVVAEKVAPQKTPVESDIGTVEKYLINSLVLYLT